MYCSHNVLYLIHTHTHILYIYIYRSLPINGWTGWMIFQIPVPRLAQAVEALGAGELLLNCINRDGQGNGYELELIQQVGRLGVWLGEFGCGENIW